MSASPGAALVWAQELVGSGELAVDDQRVGQHVSPWPKARFVQRRAVGRAVEWIQHPAHLRIVGLGLGDVCACEQRGNLHYLVVLRDGIRRPHGCRGLFPAAAQCVHLGGCPRKQRRRQHDAAGRGERPALLHAVQRMVPLAGQELHPGQPAQRPQRDPNRAPQLRHSDSALQAAPGTVDVIQAQLEPAVAHRNPLGLGAVADASGQGVVRRGCLHQMAGRRKPQPADRGRLDPGRGVITRKRERAVGPSDELLATAAGK